MALRHLLCLSPWLTLLFYTGIGMAIFAPRIFPEQKTLVVQSGDTFTLRCISSQRINWSYPSYTSERNNISYGESGNSDYPYVSQFEVAAANYQDTGFYYCTAEGDVDLVEHKEAVAEIYIYVNDSLKLLVKDREPFLLGKEHQEAIIPCRPTSPDVTVTLMVDGDDILNFDFDPKIGFILRVVHVIDSKSYECIASRGEQTETYEFHLTVISATEYVHPPSIQLQAENHQGHIEVGSTFSLNCTVNLEADTKFQLIWSTPNDIARNEGRLKIMNTTSSIKKDDGRTEQSGYRTLTIENASKKDEGTYNCTVKDHNFNLNHEVIRLDVFDKNSTYLDILDPSVPDDYISEAADSPNVLWVIHFRSYPNASVTWTNDKGEHLTTKNNMYDIANTFNTSILTIYNINLEKAGNYTVLIDNGRIQATRTKILDVFGTPSNMKISRKDKITQQDFQFFSNKDKYTLRCKLLANPAAVIEWRFQKCSSYNACSKEKIEMKGARTVSTQGYALTSEIDISTEESGKVTCMARNTHGISSTEIPFFVLDVVDGFDMIVPPETVVGYEMILSCKASIYNYTNSIQWTKDGTRFLPKEGYEVRPSSTKFSYGSDIIVKKLSKKDSGTYKCHVGSISGGGEDSQSQDVIVKDVLAPFFLGTNLNKSEVSMSRNTDILELSCVVDGTPSPPIIWYKDDVIISPKNTSTQQSTNRIELKNKNQSLILHFLRSDDEGRYKCKAENLGGSVESYVDLKVTGGGHLSPAVITIIVILLLFLTALIILLFCKIKKERELKAELTKIGLHHFESGATECINPELGVDEQAELLPYDRKWEFPRDKLKLGKQLGSGAFGVVMKGEAIGIIEGENISTVAVKMVKRNADSTHIKALASELKIMVHLGQHLNVVNLLGACTKNLMKRELLVIVEYCCYGNLQNFLLRHRHCFIDQIVNDSIDSSRGQEAMAQALAEDRKAREALEEQNRVNYTALSFQNSDGCSSPPPEFSMRHGSVSSNPSAYQWNTQHTLSTDASGQNSGNDDTALNSNNQPAWRSNYRGDYRRSGMRPILTQDLLCWAFQVARGMDYLVSRKVLHGDLAARNILLAEDNVVKICDFGLARSMYQSSNYKKTGDGPLPVKWMAVESIQDRVFSTQSDIWSFGIVLWEFFSLARTPYPGMEADEKLFNKLVDGYRMEKPRYATSAIYTLMTDCWNSEPSRRPLFADLGDRLGTMLEESVRMHYMELNNHYLMMNEQHQQSRESTAEDYLAMMSAPTYCNEMARQRTPMRDYVNLPTDDSDVNYLPMSSKNGPDSPLTEEDGYLRMNINSPSRSVIFSPTQPQAITFQFPSSSKLSPTDKKSANQNELKPMLTNPPNYTNLPQNHPPTPSEANVIGNTCDSNLPSCLLNDDDDRFGDGLKSPLSPCFENPSYQVLNQDDLGRKRGYSEASSSGFHSERDSFGHSPKPNDEPRSSPPPYQEATEMTTSVLV